MHAQFKHTRYWVINYLKNHSTSRTRRDAGISIVLVALVLVVLLSSTSRPQFPLRYFVFVFQESIRCTCNDNFLRRQHDHGNFKKVYSVPVQFPILQAYFIGKLRSSWFILLKDSFVGKNNGNLFSKNLMQDVYCNTI